MDVNSIAIDSKIMLITSFVSLACNIFIIARLEGQDDPLSGEDSEGVTTKPVEENLNVRAAIIHAVGDLL